MDQKWKRLSRVEGCAFLLKMFSQGLGKYFLIIKKNQLDAGLCQTTAYLSLLQLWMVLWGCFIFLNSINNKLIEN